MACRTCTFTAPRLFLPLRAPPGTRPNGTSLSPLRHPFSQQHCLREILRALASSTLISASWRPHAGRHQIVVARYRCVVSQTMLQHARPSVVYVHLQTVIQPTSVATWEPETSLASQQRRSLRQAPPPSSCSPQIALAVPPPIRVGRRSCPPSPARGYASRRYRVYRH